MNQECAKFIDQLSAPAESRSSEFVAHLATCASCKESMATIQALKGARMPLEASELSAISAIVNAPQVKTILSSSSLFSVKVLGLIKITIALVIVSSITIVSSISYRNFYNKETKQMKTSLNKTNIYSTQKINQNSLLFLEKKIQKLKLNLQNSSIQENREILSNIEKLLNKCKEANVSFNELKILINSPDNVKNRNLINSKKREFLALEKEFFELLKTIKTSNKNNSESLANDDFPTIDIPATSESEDAFTFSSSSSSNPYYSKP